MLDFESIGIKLKGLREQSGLTQGQLAEYLNVDQSFISKCEKNERQFSTDMLEKAGNLFGCGTEYFTNEENGYMPVSFALRANSINLEDLETIAVINKLALNLRFMENLLKGE